MAARSDTGVRSSAAFPLRWTGEKKLGRRAQRRMQKERRWSGAGFLQLVGIGGLTMLVLPSLAACHTTTDGNGILVSNQSADGLTLYGTSRSPRAWVSTNRGQTWEEMDLEPTIGTREVHRIWPLDDGELLAAVGPAKDHREPGALWRSIGFPTCGTRCRWERTLQTGYLGTVGDPAPSTPGGAITGYVEPLRRWTVDVHGPIVACCEYGIQSATDKSRYAYLSEDMGKSFARVFDIGTAPNQHTHGICYDPWWDALWLTSGDGSRRGLHVSFDRGATWGSVPLDAKGISYQFVVVVALEQCIVLTSDYQDFNGVARIPRPANGSRSPAELVVEPAWTYSVHTNRIEIIGSTTFQGGPGEPLIIVFEAESNASSMVVATHDGYHFEELWREDLDLAADQTVLYRVSAPMPTERSTSRRRTTGGIRRRASTPSSIPTTPDHSRPNSRRPDQPPVQAPVRRASQANWPQAGVAVLVVCHTRSWPSRRCWATSTRPSPSQSPTAGVPIDQPPVSLGQPAGSWPSASTACRT